MSRLSATLIALAFACLTGAPAAAQVDEAMAREALPWLIGAERATAGDIAVDPVAEIIVYRDVQGARGGDAITADRLRIDGPVIADGAVVGHDRAVLTNLAIQSPDGRFSIGEVMIEAPDTDWRALVTAIQGVDAPGGRARLADQLMSLNMPRLTVAGVASDFTTVGGNMSIGRISLRDVANGRFGQFQIHDFRTDDRVGETGFDLIEAADVDLSAFGDPSRSDLNTLFTIHQNNDAGEAAMMVDVLSRLRLGHLVIDGLSTRHETMDSATQVGRIAFADLADDGLGELSVAAFAQTTGEWFVGIDRIAASGLQIAILIDLATMANGAFGPELSSYLVGEIIGAGLPLDALSIQSVEVGSASADQRTVIDGLTVDTERRPDGAATSTVLTLTGLAVPMAVIEGPDTRAFLEALDIPGIRLSAELTDAFDPDLLTRESLLGIDVANMGRLELGTRVVNFVPTALARRMADRLAAGEPAREQAAYEAFRFAWHDDQFAPAALRALAPITGQDPDATIAAVRATVGSLGLSHGHLAEAAAAAGDAIAALLRDSGTVSISVDLDPPLPVQSLEDPVGGGVDWNAVIDSTSVTVDYQAP